MSKLTVVSHFYNEELLLPHWLAHHKTIADHGIMINYASTDRSVEIIKEICPTWEIVESENEWFMVESASAEIMKKEKEISGWKVALNTTEFLFMDTSQLVDEATNKAFIQEKTYTMVDISPSTFDSTGSLLEQKCHGFIDNNKASHKRAVHCYEDGQYDIGRHKTGFACDVLDGSYICVYSWSPWPEVLSRKLQIKNKISETDKQNRIKKGWGTYHFLSEEELTERYNKLVPRSKYIYGSDVETYGAPL